MARDAQGRLAETVSRGILRSDAAFDAPSRADDATQQYAAALTVRWTSSSSATASVDRFGSVTAHRAGPVTITAESEGARATMRYTVAANPVTSVDIQLDQQTARTGDVIHLKAVTRTAGGRNVTDAPVTWSYVYTPDDTIAAPGAIPLSIRPATRGRAALPLR